MFTKTLLAVLITAGMTTLAVADTTAVAPSNTYTQFSVESQDGLSGSSDATAYGVTLGKHIDPNVSAELYARYKDTEVGANDTRIEGAIISQDTIAGNLKGYLRLGIGEKFISGGDNFSYWNVEPGVKLGLTDKLAVKAGVRWRDAWNKANNWDRTYKLGASYSLTDNTALGVTYKQKRGDSEYNSVSLAGTIKF